MEDVDLAIQAKQGDIDAYETLMRRHQNVAQRAAYLVTGDAAEAEDAVQEAFVKAFTRWSHLRMAETFGKPPGTIRSRLFRTLARLREQLEDSADQQPHLSTDGLKGTSHG